MIKLRNHERYLTELYEDLTHDINLAIGRRCSDEYIAALKHKRLVLAEEPLKRIRKTIEENANG